ncbi:Flp family type IVb pilin [Rhodobacteraceae bacterium]|nr:Flp family type IVb pilin [Paracoccaceae bacterium]
MKQIKRLITREDGATAIEYALIAAGIAIVIIVGINLLGSNLNNTFSKVGCELRGGTYTDAVIDANGDVTTAGSCSS